MKKDFAIAILIIFFTGVPIFVFGNTKSNTTRYPAEVKVPPIGLMTEDLVREAYELVTCTGDMKSAVRPLTGEKFCYQPSGKEGISCKKQTDCGAGVCVVTSHKNCTIGPCDLSNSEIKEGTCYDLVFSCIEEFDKNGNLREICYD